MDKNSREADHGTGTIRVTRRMWVMTGPFTRGKTNAARLDPGSYDRIKNGEQARGRHRSHGAEEKAPKQERPGINHHVAPQAALSGFPLSSL